LRRAHERIEALEGRGAAEPAPSGSFLDSMRDSLFGQGQRRGSVPPVPPPGDTSGRPAWNTGQVLGGPAAAQEPYPPQQPPGGGGGGGSFLGTAAAAAAGVVGGSLLLNSIRGMMGGSSHGFGDTGARGDKSGSGSGPWGGGDQSGGNLARDAGVNDIGSGGRSADGARAGQFDQARADADHDRDQDHDDFGDDDYDDDDDGGDFGDFDGGDIDVA